MPTKSTKDNPVITNNNKNVNTVKVNVQVEHPKINVPVKVKPNWIIKAIVIGLIGLAISLLGYYLKMPSHKSGITIQPGPADSGIEQK